MSSARAESFRQLPTLLQLKAELGWGSLYAPPTPYGPLQGLQTEQSADKAPGVGTFAMGVGADVLMAFPYAAVGIRGSATTAFWCGGVFSAGLVGGPTWELGSSTTRLHVFGEFGWDVFGGVGGGLGTNGISAWVGLPQAGGAVSLTFPAWNRIPIVLELWGRATLWRHDAVFTQIEDGYFSILGHFHSEKELRVPVGGFLFGVSLGYSLR